jgi:amino acid transporter
MLGWLVALMIVICDSMVWSELGAAMPGSGGSFGYLREAFGRETFGRLMDFLFVWQFILSGPLEIASGYIGFSQYVGYLWHGLSARAIFLVAAGVGLLNILLLYRRVASIATVTVSLWAGTLVSANPLASWWMTLSFVTTTVKAPAISFFAIIASIAAPTPASFGSWAKAVKAAASARTTARR